MVQFVEVNRKLVPQCQVAAVSAYIAELCCVYNSIFASLPLDPSLIGKILKIAGTELWVKQWEPLTVSRVEKY